MKGLKNQKEYSEEVEQEEISSFKKKVNGIKEKLRLGPHYKMERFAVLISVSLAFLLMFTTSAFVKYRSDISNLASAQAVFTKDFSFSLTNERGKIEGVYGNEDKTDVMVLFKFQNPREMSSNAKNYELFITGQKKKLKDEPKVTFSLFGSTGYGIIRFQDEEPIKKEILSVTIRSTKDISSGSGSGAGKDKDGSFDQFDQARIYINPGAEVVETLDYLETGEKDPAKLYIALVAKEKDDEIREEIAERTETLKKYINRADEYAERITSSGYICPDIPWFIEGDMVDDNNVFKPNSYVEGAHKFDYWTKNIEDGYITQVMSDFSQFDDYMAKHNANPERNPDKPESIDRISEIEHTDGSVLYLDTVVTDRSSSAQVTVKDSIESLSRVWRDYVTEKGRLQRDLLRSLIVLDADVQSQHINYSENTEEDAVTFY